MKKREEIAEELSGIDVKIMSAVPWQSSVPIQRTAYLAQADYVLGLLAEERMPSEEKIAIMAMDLFGWTHVDGNWQNLIPHVRIFLHGVKTGVTPAVPANALTEDEKAFWDAIMISSLVPEKGISIEVAADFADMALAARRRAFR